MTLRLTPRETKILRCHIERLGAKRTLKVEVYEFHLFLDWLTDPDVSPTEKHQALKEIE